jgi:hypothetical protein
MDRPVMTNVLMARLAPGVVNQGTTPCLTQGRGGSSGFFAPLSLGQKEWSIDGGPNLGSGGIAFTPYTDQITDFKIEPTGFDASLGHSIGLNIAFSTKSGTNSPHGSATGQYWNSRCNAASFLFNRSTSRTSTRPPPVATAPWYASWHRGRCSLEDTQTITGSHSGGPVYIPKILNGKNKLFWFFSYSGEQDSPAGAVERNQQYGSHHGGTPGQLLGPSGDQREIPNLRSADRDR